MRPLQAQSASSGTIQSSWWVVTVMLHDIELSRRLSFLMPRSNDERRLSINVTDYKKAISGFGTCYCRSGCPYRRHYPIRSIFCAPGRAVGVRQHGLIRSVVTRWGMLTGGGLALPAILTGLTLELFTTPALNILWIHRLVCWWY